MNVNSALNIGIQGVNKAMEDANQAAANIASNVLYKSTNIDTQAEDINVQQAPVNQLNSGNLTRAVVDLHVVEFQAKASSSIIKSADDNLGTLLDVRV